MVHGLWFLVGLLLFSSSVLAQSSSFDPSYSRSDIFDSHGFDPRLGVDLYDSDRNQFDRYVDLKDLDWFDRGIYRASLPHQDCIDLDEFYAYADSNPFDGLDRENVKAFKYQLGYDDLRTLAAENPSDGITSDDYSIVEDLHCSTPSEYRRWSSSRPSFDDDDYYSVFSYNSAADFEDRFDHYPVNDYWQPAHPSGLVRTDGSGGFASWVPFTWW